MLIIECSCVLCFLNHSSIIMSKYVIKSKAKMPRKKFADENEEISSSYNKRNLLHEPVTLHIMREMDVMPLSPSPYTADYYSDDEKQGQVKPLQVVNGNKRRLLVIPQKSPYFKACRDDFILFQKSPQFHPPGEDHFSKLSDEMILQVFQWLPKTSLIKCAEVCKRWKYLSYDESLWSRYDFGKRYVGSGVLDTLLKRGVSVLRLAMCEIRCPVFLESEFAKRQRFSRLQYLDLSMATLSTDALAEILAVCNRLKKLSLEACEINDNCCRYISQNKDLEVLNMTMSVGLSHVGLTEIATKCLKLKEWNLAWTHLSVSTMKSFLPTLPKSLTRLNISGHCETLENKDLVTIAKCCPNLIELDISDCHNLNEESFTPLIRLCSKLEHLHTSRAYQIPTHCYRHLKYLKNFRKLEIFRTLTDEALAYLRESMPNIKINTELFSTIARPTTGVKRTSIWGLRVRD